MPATKIMRVIFLACVMVWFLGLLLLSIKNSQHAVTVVREKDGRGHASGRQAMPCPYKPSPSIMADLRQRLRQRLSTAAQSPDGPQELDGWRRSLAARASTCLRVSSREPEQSMRSVA